MNRNPEFEIQYLISLTIAILGSVSAPVIRYVVDPRIAALLIISVMIHILVYTLAYSIKNSISVELDFVETLDTLADYTLLLVSTLFLYFILTSIAAAAWDLTTGGLGTSAVGHSPLQLTLYHLMIPPIPTPDLRVSVVRTIVVYVVPLLIMAGVGIYAFIDPYKKYRILREIEITFQPEYIRVFNNFDDTQFARFRIINNTEVAQQFNLKIKTPEDVRYRINERDSTIDSGVHEQSLSVKPYPYQELIFIDFEYLGDKRRGDTIQANLHHEHGSWNLEIDTLLIPE